MEKANPSDPIDLVKRGDLVIINPNTGNNPDRYGYWDGAPDRREDSEFVYFIARVDDHMVVEDATRKRRLMSIEWLKEIVFKAVYSVVDVGDYGPL